MDRRQFLRCAAGAFTVSSLATALTACKSGVGGGPNPEATGGGVFRFPQGLACGDPSPTSGVFWTRVIRGDGQQGDIPVVLELSRTPIPEGENSFRLAMTIPVVAKQENDYIIHHKVTGLEPDTIYYFRFVASGDWSHPVGRFRSLPSGEAEVSRTQFGVINGFDWNLGHWEGLVALQNNFRELFYVIQLGGAINEMIPVAGSNRLEAMPASDRRQPAVACVPRSGFDGGLPAARASFHIHPGREERQAPALSLAAHLLDLGPRLGPQAMIEAGHPQPPAAANRLTGKDIEQAQTVRPTRHRHQDR